MKVLNIHTRNISVPKSAVEKLFTTLASKEDKIWPTENWPAMRFPKGMHVGSVGGHGPVGYSIEEFIPGEMIKFNFLKPNGFFGFHKLEIFEKDVEQTTIKHTIDMSTSFIGTISWFAVIKWLHDALIEDAYDKVENQLAGINKNSKWNLWVKFLRTILG